jgi:signal transduction histidine kinase
VVESLAAGARPLAEQKGVALETVGLGDLPVVNVDSEAIEKVIVNLLGNALKFTDRGGRIEVRGICEEGVVHLVVSDTGVGITADQLDRIFDRFAQADSSSTRRFEGTGIGLALVKELVQLHGGRIWAESAGAGQGAQLHVVLPEGEADAELQEEVLTAADSPVAASRGAPSAPEDEIDADRREGDWLRLVQLQQNVERAEFDSRESSPGEVAPELPADAGDVLVVEDNADMRQLLVFLLSREFRVRAARNGREGLESAREESPDLILTDVMMPEMSGTELCREIKGDPRTEGIPVVLVTSKAEREMKIEGLELGADDYVTKPFHPRELLARVRSLVRLRRLREELAVRNSLLESTNEELKCTLAELQEAGSRLVQAERLAAVGELAAGVAHEVNNPVNFATNALKTLRANVEETRRVAEALAGLDLSDPERLGEQLEKLEQLRQEFDLEGLSDALGELVGIATEGLERTHRLVGDLRDFAAPGQGQLSGVDVGRGLRSTLQLLNYAMRQAGVESELSLEEDLPQPRGDTRALNQVFLNLVKNATEALEETGGTVAVGARAEGDSIVVTVRDDGPGIAREEQARLFEPFFSTKQAGRGTGLGLSISRRIVMEHGGSIGVDSSPGEGTTFTVRLPVEAADGAT